jgi:hypothetical protein
MGLRRMMLREALNPTRTTARIPTISPASDAAG